MTSSLFRNRLSQNFFDYFKSSGNLFYSSVVPQPINNPAWVSCNLDLADNLGISADELQDPSNLLLMSGSHFDDTNSISLVYSGHQFGQWAGQLGDGRAITLGELPVGESSELWDIQLKGAGKTPYSRFGDGRAVLRSSIREYLCSQDKFAKIKIFDFGKSYFDVKSTASVAVS